MNDSNKTKSCLDVLLIATVSTLLTFTVEAGTLEGDRLSLGQGYIQSYVTVNETGTPLAIGIQFPESMLSGLPTEPADGTNCWDVNGDGTLSMHDPVECVAGHQRVVFLPDHAGSSPFKFVQVNWNPLGHIPPGVYDVPHFDIHFYIMDYVAHNHIRPGPCGPELVHCDDFKTARQPVPKKFVHPSFQDVQAVVPRMGNHLIDTSGHEFLPRPPAGKGGPFDHSFIYGSYAGQIIFWEAMITNAFLLGRPDTCVDIKLPDAYERPGHYPTKYCMRYLPERGMYTVSLEGMVMRK